MNTSFLEFFKLQLANNLTLNLCSATQDYIDYAKQLEGRYLPRYGEVLTFGSGDCGQLAHGVEKDEDLMVNINYSVFETYN